MRNIIQSCIVVSLLILIVAIVFNESRFVGQQDRLNSGPFMNPRQWGRWCSDDNECGRGFCQAYICQCYPGYITWRYMDACAYEQRKKLTVFLLSLFVGMFGVDWFVLSRGTAGYIVAGIIKALVTCSCCLIWPCVFINLRKKSRRQNLFVNMINVILTICSLVWWLIDWIRILSDVFYDGHGAPLYPWTRPNYYNRIPYHV